MLDRTIPYYNIIMKGDSRKAADICPPQGYALRAYCAGDELAWARMEWAVGDFPTRDAAIAYFAENFGGAQEALARRMTVALAPDGAVVGACMAWREKRGEETASFVHWLVVDPAHQGRGLGRALCAKTLQIFRSLGEYEVYLHTQPWSYMAIMLYDSLGFYMRRRGTFLGKKNEYAQAMDTLAGVLPPQAICRLREHTQE